MHTVYISLHINKCSQCITMFKSICGSCIHWCVPLQAKDQRLNVDVVLEAPVICVPLSIPNQALVVNTGVLKVKNRCEQKQVDIEKGRSEVVQFKSVFETFEIALDNFSIVR